MRKKILALSLTTVMALSALTGVLVTRNANVEPMTNETAMLVDDEESGEVLAANYTQEDFERVAKEAFDIINNIRKENGLSPLKWGGDWISDVRAEEITTVFSHYSESGISDGVGENCARTNSLNAQHVVDLWMNSAGHKRQILDDFDQYAAMSVVQKDGRFYWSNIFIGPKTYEELESKHQEELKKQEAEKKNQPSSVAAEVKQEEQKPATEVKQETKPEVKQEVKQETKPEVKEEQKPVITPEVKQKEVKPEVKEEQVPASKAVETTPVPSSAAAQETASQYDYGLGKGTNGTDIVPVRIHYDKETDQYSSTVVTPEEWEQIKSNRQQRAETQTPSVQNETQPVQSNVLRSSQSVTRSQPSISEGETNSEGHRVVSRTTETRSDGVEIVKEESIAPNGTVWNSWWLAD